LTHNKKVIPFLVEERWTFWEYQNAIEEWGSEDALDMLNAMLKNLAKIERFSDWKGQGFRKFLTGRKEKVFELGFRADNRECRILCVFPADIAVQCWPTPPKSTRKRVVMLVGCYHKQNVYMPAEALDTADKRVRFLREGNGRLYERQIDPSI